LEAETRDEWELLQEHLRNDPLWAALAQWKKALAAHLLERAEFDDKVVAVLQKKTSLEIVDNRDVPPLVGHSVADVFLKLKQRDALGIRESPSLEKGNDIDATTGLVTNDGSRPVMARFTGSEEQWKKDLSDAFREADALSKDSPVADTYRVLVEATARAAKAAKEISLLGLILGQCRICGRLGV
jgi:hypothetical protein